MTGAGDVEHVEVVLLDDPVQVHIDEVLTRRRAPVSDHQRLHVRQLQRLASAADYRRDRSARPTGSWRRASRRPSSGVVRGEHTCFRAARFHRCRLHGARLLVQPRPRTLQTVLAIMSSSSVRMTWTATLPAPDDSTSSFPAFRARLRSIPRNPSPSQIRARTGGRVHRRSPLPQDSCVFQRDRDAVAMRYHPRRIVRRRAGRRIPRADKHSRPTRRPMVERASSPAAREHRP